MKEQKTRSDPGQIFHAARPVGTHRRIFHLCFAKFAFDGKGELDNIIILNRHFS